MITTMEIMFCSIFFKNVIIIEKENTQFVTHLITYVACFLNKNHMSSLHYKIGFATSIILDKTLQHVTCAFATKLTCWLQKN
jgi:hypothetical protein